MFSCVLSVLTCGKRTEKWWQYLARPFNKIVSCKRNLAMWSLLTFSRTLFFAEIWHFWFFFTVCFARLRHIIVVVMRSIRIIVFYSLNFDFLLNKLLLLFLVSIFFEKLSGNRLLLCDVWCGECQFFLLFIDCEGRNLSLNLIWKTTARVTFLADNQSRWACRRLLFVFLTLLLSRSETQATLFTLDFIGKARIEDIYFALWAPDEHFSVLWIVIDFEAM